MHNSTIYYQGGNERCEKIARGMADFLEGEMVNAELTRQDYLHFRDAECMGFIFESKNGKVPEDIDWLIRHMIVRKNVYVFLIIPGGKRETLALRSAYNQLASRGYQVSGAYTEALLEREHIPREDWGKYIATSCRDRIDRLADNRDQIEEMSTHDLRRGMRRSVRDYVSLRRDKRKKTED